MAKSASPIHLSPDPDPETAQRVAKLRRTRERKASQPKPVAAPGNGSPALARALALRPSSSSMKPLLIGVGIGAALMGTAVVMRSKSDKASNISPFHGPNSALAGALTKTALFALARVVSGQTVRAVATRALLEVAGAWKA